MLRVYHSTLNLSTINAKLLIGGFFLPIQDFRPKMQREGFSV